jgi:hypothetical protein
MLEQMASLECTQSSTKVSGQNKHFPDESHLFPLVMAGAVVDRNAEPPLTDPRRCEPIF